MLLFTFVSFTLINWYEQYYFFFFFALSFFSFAVVSVSFGRSLHKNLSSFFLSWIELKIAGISQMCVVRAAHKLMSVVNFLISMHFSSHTKKNSSSSSSSLHPKNYAPAAAAKKKKKWQTFQEERRFNHVIINHFHL